MTGDFKDCEFYVGYDYFVNTDSYKIDTKIIKILDNYKDAIKYMQNQEKNYPGKALWVQIKRKRKNDS